MTSLKAESLINSSKEASPACCLPNNDHPSCTEQNGYVCMCMAHPFTASGFFEQPFQLLTHIPHTRSFNREKEVSQLLEWHLTYQTYHKIAFLQTVYNYTHQFGYEISVKLMSTCPAITIYSSSIRQGVHSCLGQQEFTGCVPAPHTSKLRINLVHLAHIMFHVPLLNHISLEWP